MADYDYLIACGGTAGCILANRLTASGQYRVLLLEAVRETSSMWVHIPAGFSKLMTNPRFNWGFQTEPEDNVHGRTIAVQRGKGLGGSTLINGMIYVRGQDQDYADWHAAGAQGRSFGDIKPDLRHPRSQPQGGKSH